MSSQRLGLQQRLQQKLSPQQIQLMKLLQIPAATLEQRIKEEIQENPALEEGEDHEEEADANEEEETVADEEEEVTEKEEDLSLDEYLDDDEIPDYKTSVNNSSPDDQRRETPLSTTGSFQDQLLSQLYQCNFDDREYHIAEQLIGSIDDDGYLRRDLNAVTDDLLFSQNISTTTEELEKILKSIQALDPPGIGARNLQECLLLQLMRKDQQRPAVQLAEKILRDFMDEF